MPLRERSGKWHFRFRLDGRRYEGTTGLAATSRNERKAQEMELDYLRADVRELRQFGRPALVPKPTIENAA